MRSWQKCVFWFQVKPTKLERAYNFLDTITKRGPTAFKIFVEALESTGQVGESPNISKTDLEVHLANRYSIRRRYHALFDLKYVYILLVLQST